MYMYTCLKIYCICINFKLGCTSLLIYSYDIKSLFVVFHNIINPFVGKIHRFVKRYNVLVIIFLYIRK